MSDKSAVQVKFVIIVGSNPNLPLFRLSKNSGIKRLFHPNMYIFQRFRVGHGRQWLHLPMKQAERGKPGKLWGTNPLPGKRII